MIEIKNIYKHLRYMRGTYIGVGDRGEERIGEKISPKVIQDEFCSDPLT